MTLAAARPNSPWLPYIDLACAAAAGALWYGFPRIGPWPLCLALLPWVVRLATEKRLSRRTPFDLPLLLFLLTAGLAVWSAYDRGVAWSKFWLVVGAVLLFYALANAQAIAGQRLWILSLFGTGVALYFLATHDWTVYPAKIAALTQLGRRLQAPLPPLPGHRLHPNVAGGIVAMMLPFAAWATLLCWHEALVPSRKEQRSRAFRGWIRLGLAAILLAVALFGLLMTTSRGAWIGLATASGLAALWGFAGGLSRRAPRRRPTWFLGLAGALLLAGGAAAALWIDALDLSAAPVAVPGDTLPAGGARSAPAPALDAAQTPLPGGATSEPRLELLRNSLTLVKDYAFIGGGLGGFMMLYSTYSLLLHVGFTVHSHNLFVDVAVEQGLPAALLLVAMAVGLGLAWWRAVRSGTEHNHPRSVDRWSQGALGAACLSLVVVWVHGQVDDALYGSRAVLLLFLPLAFAASAARQGGRRGRQSGVAAATARTSLSARVVTLTILGLAVVTAAALLSRNLIVSRVASNLGAVRQSQAELALYRWPEWPLQDELRRSGAADLRPALAWFERALVLDPRNAVANRRLGMIELSIGDYRAALEHLERAFDREPWSDATRQLLGEAYLTTGRLTEGQALWDGVRNGQGQLSARVWWYGYIGDDERAARLAAAIP